MNEPGLSNENQSAAEVWPPPPTGVPPIFYGRPAFVSGQGLCRITVILLAVGIAIDAVEAVLLGMRTPATLKMEVAITFVDSAISLVMAISFLVWTHHAYRNLQAFGAEGLRWTPGWAVGYFFVPVMNLYRPYQIFSEIWRASDSSAAALTGADRQRLKTPGLLLGWWLCYIGAGLIGAFSSWPGAGNGLPILAEFASAASGVLAILVVQRVTARQEETENKRLAVAS